MEGTITGKFFKDSDVLPLYEQTLPVLEWRSSLRCPARSQHQGTSTSASAHEFSVVLVASTWCHTDLIPFARVLCNALPPDHHRHPDWMMTAEPIAGIGRLSSWPHTALLRAELRKAPTPHHRTPVQQVGIGASQGLPGSFSRRGTAVTAGRQEQRCSEAYLEAHGQSWASAPCMVASGGSVGLTRSVTSTTRLPHVARHTLSIPEALPRVWPFTIGDSPRAFCFLRPIQRLSGITYSNS